jgi:hypothetical protein
VPSERTVTFPIVNRMFGVDGLARCRNALVSDNQTGDWHPGPWSDWDRAAIEIDFVGATLAKRLCLEDTAGLPSRSLVET